MVQSTKLHLANGKSVKEAKLSRDITSETTLNLERIWWGLDFCTLKKWLQSQKLSKNASNSPHI
jgi:hypothetical protein